MNENNLIEPSFSLEIPGYEFLGRGPESTGVNNGWPRSPDIYFRCVSCGEMMCSDHTGYYDCRCESMNLDWDAGRFGSSLGDLNILVYRKSDK